MINLLLNIQKFRQILSFVLEKGFSNKESLFNNHHPDRWIKSRLNFFQTDWLSWSLAIDHNDIRTPNYYQKILRLILLELEILGLWYDSPNKHIPYLEVLVTETEPTSDNITFDKPTETLISLERNDKSWTRFESESSTPSYYPKKLVYIRNWD